MLPVYYSLAIGSLTHYRGKLFSYLAIVFLGLFAALRGSVGTDTVAYEDIFSLLRVPFGFPGYEPGFSLVIWFLALFIQSDEILVRIVSVIFTILLLIYVRRSNSDELFFVIAFFLPMFFFQYSMNVLRIGLASILILLAFQYYTRQKFYLWLLFSVLGVAFHFSAIFLFILVCIMSKIFSPRHVVYMVAFFPPLIFALLLSAESILPRIFLYSEMRSPSQFSGFSLLFVMFPILLAVLVSGLSYADRLFFVVINTFLAVALIFLSSYSYAGLRLLNLLLLAAPISLVILKKANFLNLNPKSKICFIVAGLLGFIFNMRGFLSTAEVGDSPFIPYEFLIK